MTDAEQSTAELRTLLDFARRLSLDQATVQEIYETVAREAMATGASNDRMAEVRKRMLAAASVSGAKWGSGAEVAKGRRSFDCTRRVPVEALDNV